MYLCIPITSHPAVLFVMMLLDNHLPGMVTPIYLASYPSGGIYTIKQCNYNYFINNY